MINNKNGTLKLKIVMEHIHNWILIYIKTFTPLIEQVKIENKK